MSPLDRSRPPAPKVAEHWNHPEVDRFQLPNGLHVWLVERGGLPIFTATLVLHSGAMHDTPEKWGCSSLAGECLDRGTRSKDALTIAEELEYLGSSLYTRVSHDGTIVSLTSLARNSRPSLTIMAEVLAEASFPEEEVERVRKQRLAKILQQRDRPGFLAAAALQRLLYGARHPYGTDSGGTEGTVRSLSRQDLVDVHGGSFQPWNATLVLIAPHPASTARELLSASFSRWESPQGAVAPLPEIPTLDSGGILLIDRPGSAQAEIRIGRPSLRRNSPDFFPVIVMNRVLGGQFTSRLNATLREKRGFTYGAWSSFGFGKLGGPFMAGAAVQTEHTGEAIVEFRNEINRMHADGLTDTELQFSIEGIAGGFALAFETPGQVASILQNIILYSLPHDYYAHFLENLRRVSVHSTREVASRYLDTGGMTTVIVGDRASVLPQLESARLGPVAVTSLEALGI